MYHVPVQHVAGVRKDNQLNVGVYHEVLSVCMYKSHPLVCVCVCVRASM